MCNSSSLHTHTTWGEAFQLKAKYVYYCTPADIEGDIIEVYNLRCLLWIVIKVMTASVRSVIGSSSLVPL